MESEKVKEIKKYIISSVIVYVMCFLMISTAVIIIYFPTLREGFAKFFNCNPMSWEESKNLLLVDYLIAIPLSVLFGIVIKPIIYEEFI